MVGFGVILYVVLLLLISEIISILVGEVGDVFVCCMVFFGGVCVFSEYVLGVCLVILGCWVGVGSCDEVFGYYGVMYFFEYLLFKGIMCCFVFDIVVVFDVVGGEVNVVIGKEYMCYYVCVFDEDFMLVGDVIIDMVILVMLKVEDVDVECGVIFEELVMNDDDLVDVVFGEGMLSFIGVFVNSIVIMVFVVFLLILLLILVVYVFVWMNFKGCDVFFVVVFVL